MKTETILNRADGSKIKISCTFNYNHTGYNYRISISKCEPRKRLFKVINVTDDYQYRLLPFGGPERSKFELNEYLKHVTVEEIQSAKILTWNTLKPE